MQPGDWVRYKENGPTLARYVKNTGLIVDIDDTHRQTVCTLLMDNGKLVSHVWIESIEVINEQDTV